MFIQRGGCDSFFRIARQLAETANPNDLGIIIEFLASLGQHVAFTKRKNRPNPPNQIHVEEIYDKLLYFLPGLLFEEYSLLTQEQKDGLYVLFCRHSEFAKEIPDGVSGTESDARISLAILEAVKHF